MKFLKSRSVGFWLSAVAAILAIVSFIYYCVADAGETAYNNDYTVIVGILILVAIACEAVVTIVPKLDFLKILSVFCYGISVVLMIDGRVTWFVAIQASASDAFWQNSIVVALVLIAISTVVAIVSGFMRQTAKQ